MMVGTDYGDSRYWQFGMVLGGGMPQMTSRFGKIEADDFTVGFYSKLNVFDSFTANTFLGYGPQLYRMKRHDFSGHYEGKFQGDAMYASVELVRPVSMPFGLLLPLVALDYQAAWTEAFSETGGIFNQSLDAGNTDRCMLRFGVDGRFHYQSLFDVSTRLQYAFLANRADQNSIVSRVGGTNVAMNLLGVEMGKGQFNAGISLSGEYRSRYRWFVDIDGYAASRLIACQGQLGLSTRW
jgi:outer membrane autotransporter protein